MTMLRTAFVSVLHVAPADDMHAEQVCAESSSSVCADGHWDPPAWQDFVPCNTTNSHLHAGNVALSVAGHALPAA